MTRYAVEAPDRPMSLIISPLSAEAIPLAKLLSTSMAGASTAWPAANLAYFVPFEVRDRASFSAVKAMIANGSAVAGNVDVGIYDDDFHLIASTGPVAQAGTSTVQDLGALVARLGPGRYHLGISCSSGSATGLMLTPYVAGGLAAMGVAQQSSAHPLPATATPVVCAQTVLPLFGVSSVAVF